jgi:LPXTG-motif cell wall-anchored protein
VAPTTKPDPKSSTTGVVVTEAEDELPFTGGTAWGPILGLLALAAGGVLLLMSRRRSAGQS